MRRTLLSSLVFVVLTAGVTNAPAEITDAQVFTLGSVYYPGDNGHQLDLIVPRGSYLFYTNYDSFAPHSFTHYVGLNARGAPLEDPDHEHYFDSGTYSGGRGTRVAGIENLPAGDYLFYCYVHPGMRGVLTIIDGL